MPPFLIGTSMTGLSATGITRRFGDVTALDGVDLTLVPGEVHALLGENGAGKSTLLAILSGLVRPDQGSISRDGATLALDSPGDALDAGIATVFQHFTLVPNLTVHQNLRLGLSRKERMDVAELDGRLREIGIGIPPDAPIEELSAGQRQTVEIAKALLHKPAFLLLDEPTSVLSGPEIDRLLQVVRRVAERGTGVLLVTHKLAEALAVADRVTVLRAGRTSGEIDLAPIAAAERPRITYQLVNLMFGERHSAATEEGLDPVRAQVHLLSEATPRQGDIVARLTGITARSDRGGTALDGLSLVLARGDLLGIAGVEGNGQRELVEVLAGERAIESGSVEIAGRPLTNAGVRSSIEAGIGVISEERLAVGVVPGTSLATNLALKHLHEPPFAKGVRADRRAITAFARDLIAKFDIRPPDPDLPFNHLSGGNIQKALLARELAFGPGVLVCHQPTAGLDAATAEVVLRHLRDAANTGAGVILISADLDEMLHSCDRIGVLYRGRIVRVLARPEFDANRIARMMVTGQDRAT